MSNIFIYLGKISRVIILFFVVRIKAIYAFWDRGYQRADKKALFGVNRCSL
jgi:hypothetical protein